jgi:Cdc6-like AAA superfamily ATPase
MFKLSKKKERAVAFIPGSTVKTDQYINLHEDADLVALESSEKLHLLPNTGEHRQTLYVAGRSGSGKSYFTAQYMRDWLRYNPKKTGRVIYIFSSLTSDKVFDDIIKSHPDQVHRVTVDKALIENPINLDTEIEHGSMLIFDDIDVLPTKERKYIASLIMGVLQIGRHFNLSVVITSHLINGGIDRNASRIIHSESHYTVLFPNGLARTHLNYYFENYAGISKDQQALLLKQRSRAVIISKTYPAFGLTEKKIFPLVG